MPGDPVITPLVLGSFRRYSSWAFKTCCRSWERSSECYHRFNKLKMCFLTPPPPTPQCMINSDAHQTSGRINSNIRGVSLKKKSSACDVFRKVHLLSWNQNMCASLRGDNLEEAVRVSRHFKQQSCNNSLIELLKAFPLGAAIPLWALLVGISNWINKPTDFGVRSGQEHIFPSFSTTILAQPGPLNQPVDWLVNCSESPRPPSDFYPKDPGDRRFLRGLWDLCKHRPVAISFIPAFCYSSAEREAWDWIYSVME